MLLEQLSRGEGKEVVRTLVHLFMLNTLLRGILGQAPLSITPLSNGLASTDQGYALKPLMM